MGVRDWLEKLLASRSDVDAAQERARTAELDVTPIAETKPREVVEVGGVIRTVTLQPRGAQVKSEAELYDGSAALRLIWLGQRTISGIEPGQRARIRGRLAIVNGERTIFNPYYELLPRAGT